MWNKIKNILKIKRIRIVARKVFFKDKYLDEPDYVIQKRHKWLFWKWQDVERYDNLKLAKSRLWLYRKHKKNERVVYSE